MWHHIQAHTISLYVTFGHTFRFRFTREVSTENRDIDTSKCQDNNPQNMLINKNERNLHNDILAHGKEA